MIDFTICALTNLFRIVLIDRFVSIFSGKDGGKKKGKLVVCGCFFIVNTALYWKFHIAWINIFSNLIGISAIVCLYTKSIKTILFVTSTVYLINCGCDVAVFSLFTDYQDGKTYDQVYAVIVLFLILICELLTEKIITIRKNSKDAQNFPLILVPLCSIAVIWFLIYSGACEGRETAIVSIGLLVINFLMLYLYNLLLRSILHKYETEMLKQKVQVYANQLDVIRQSEEKIKVLRHDMKHHMNELKLLANRYGIVEIQEYINHMEAYIQNPNEIVSSGNMEIDSVLNYMLRKAREELETVIVKVMLPEKIKHTFEINVLIGNLLENAIEAARKTDKKYLNVNMALKRGVLKIRVENSFLPTELVKEKQAGMENFLTTKEAKQQHGIGLKSVRKIVEAYNGTMEAAPQNDIFRVNLILYMSKVENEI